MSNWLSSAWKRNRGAIGNAVKNVSPLLAFTPLGPLGAGAAGALGRAIQPGANAGSILKSGLSNAAIGGGAAGLAKGAAGSLAGRMPTADAFSQPASLTQRVQGALGSAGHGIKSGLQTSWKADPVGTIGALGQTAGGVMEGRSQNAALNFQRQQYEDEQRRRAAMAEALAPLFKSMYADQQQYYGPRR